MKTLYALTLIVCAVLATVAHAACPSTPGRFIPVADKPSEVLDTQTQLIWARCSVGLTWSGSDCTGTPTTMTHEAALAYAVAQSGWRVPNVKELSSLVDRGCIIPAIDSAVFPNTVSNWYWSSSPYTADGNSALFVFFNQGNVSTGLRNDVYNVRLVR